MTTRFALAVSLLMAGAQSASSQRIEFRVRDSLSGRPLDAVTVAVRDSAGRQLAVLRTNDSGVVAFGADRPGWYSFELRQLGFRPLQTGVYRLQASTSIVAELRLKAVVTALDTVVTRDTRSLFNVTPGREFFRRHMLENKGMFVSGFELQRSGLSTSEYLGQLPGIRLTAIGASQPGPEKGQPVRPVVPGADGRVLTSTYGSNCLYARIDRWSLLDLIISRRVYTVDELVKVSDIAAVEVYGSYRQLPLEWQANGWPKRLIRISRPGVSALFGDMSTQRYPLVQIGRTDQTNLRPIVSGSRESLDPWLTEIVNASLPPCGFIQIWTRVAW